MIPQRFANANIEMQAPKGDDNCNPLWCHRGQYPDGTPCFISAWRPTPAELVKINLGEPIWLHVVSGALPPTLMTMDDPFAAREDSDA